MAKLTVEEVVDDLASLIQDGKDFIVSEFSDDWEMAELYYAGGTELPNDEGRSSMVKTEVRDVIRVLMPDILRTLLQSRKIVEYTPNNVTQARYVEQQAHWVTHMFMQSGGYMQLVSAIQESLKMKAGPIKVWWEENPAPEFFKVTAISETEVLEYMELPDVVVESVTETEYDDNSPFQGSGLYDLTATRYFVNGRIRFEAFPMYEFFCMRNANNLEEFPHGQRRSITVREALEMGVDENTNFDELDNDDPEVNEAQAAATIRRGYAPDDEGKSNVDPLNKEFLLTEVYCHYDMDGDGVSEKYCFWLGGSKYKYLGHEQVEDFAIDLVRHDPMPFTVIGRSIPDIVKQSQDNMTSILRIMIDNGHAANNPRPAADPTRTDFKDLMNNAIGAPIKTKGDPNIQVFDIPFTAGQMMPVMQWMEQNSQEQVGVTKAASGLDPNAMQSTDKQAVMNTIMMGRGQVEYMVRNIIETALIPLFKKALKLSMRHMDPIQLLPFKGAVVPVNIRNFNADLMAVPNVGLGTRSPEVRLQTLNFVYAEQQKYMERFGLDNPFTSLSQMYNTLEDMVELGGLPSVGRYFNLVNRDMEQVIAQKLAEDAAAQAEEAKKMQPADPGKTLLAIEGMKSRSSAQKMLADMRSKELSLQADALKEAERIDLERDKLRQERFLRLVELKSQGLNNTIQGELDGTKAKPVAVSQQSTDSTGMSGVAAE